jgi:hypothetical protein
MSKLSTSNNLKYALQDGKPLALRPPEIESIALLTLD